MCNATKGRRRSIIEAEASIAFLEQVNSSSLSETLEKKDRRKITKTKSKTSTSTSVKSNKGETKRREIQHNYHDHADDDGAVYRNTPMVSKGGVTVPFPMKLHNMLDHIAQHEPQLSSIATWQPHGRSFIVHNINQFTEDVLPRFFQQRKYASFQRQLNLYGFTRLTKGPDRGSYYHELFLRSKKILCRGIVRMKVKGTGSRMASNPEQEPNFYRMTYMPAPSPENEDTTIPHPDSTVKSLDLDSVKTTTETVSAVLPMPTISLSSSGYEKRASSSSNKPVPIATQSSSFLNRPRDSTGTQNDDVDKDIETIDFVFENMPFYGLENSECSRRHSLMDIQRARRLSAQFLSNRRGSSSSSLRNSFLLTGGSSEGRRSSVKSINLGDDDFTKEMEAIYRLGETVFTDQEMSGVLDKIIDH